MKENAHIKQLISILLIMLLMVGCSTPAPTSVPPSETPAPTVTTIPTETQLPPKTPTPTPAPTFTPIPTYTEDFSIPECIADGSKEELWFDDAMEALYPTMSEMESYRYRTIYRYKTSDDYAEDELSLEILGEHNGLLPEDEDYHSVDLISQRHESSHVTLTDLKTMAQIEAILTEDGVWIRPSLESDWIEIAGGSRWQFANPADLFSPWAVGFMLAGGGSLSPGTRANIPLMTSTEVIDGVDVTHRCWKPEPDYDETAEISDQINSYLIHRDSLYTFLGDTEVHLWTADDDTQFVRLAARGKQLSDRYWDYGFLDHVPPNDFVLWVELFDVNQPLEIDPPAPDEIVQVIPDSKLDCTASSNISFSDLPLPSGAEKVLEPTWEEIELDIEASGITSKNTEPFRPREFINYISDFEHEQLGDHVGSNWYETPQDRISVHETDMDIESLISLYKEEMCKRGWDLKDAAFDTGLPRYYLFFTRDQVTMPVVLSAGPGQTSRIWALLPPDDEIVEAVLSGWKQYSVENSGLVSRHVNDIAFDSVGNAWIGTPEGLIFFDGENWTAYNSSNSGLISDDISALAVDTNDHIWVATEGGMNVYDGESWGVYTEGDYKLGGYLEDVVIGHNDEVWIISNHYQEGGISHFDTSRWKKLEHLYDVLALDFDPSGKLWIGTNTGGIYSLDGDEWEEFAAPKGDSGLSSNDNISNLAFDDLGQMWTLSADLTLSVFDGDSSKSYKACGIEGYRYSPDSSLVVDQFNRVWVTSSSGGLCMLTEDGAWVDYTPLGTEISLDYGDWMVIDPQGQIWIDSQDGFAVFSPPTP